VPVTLPRRTTSSSPSRECCSSTRPLKKSDGPRRRPTRGVLSRSKGLPDDLRDIFVVRFRSRRRFQWSQGGSGSPREGMPRTVATTRNEQPRRKCSAPRTSSWGSAWLRSTPLSIPGLFSRTRWDRSEPDRIVRLLEGGQVRGSGVDVRRGQGIRLRPLRRPGRARGVHGAALDHGRRAGGPPTQSRTSDRFLGQAPLGAAAAVPDSLTALPARC
jgi:hypothetical protein